MLILIACFLLLIDCVQGGRNIDAKSLIAAAPEVDYAFGRRQGMNVGIRDESLHVENDTPREYANEALSTVHLVYSCFQSQYDSVDKSIPYRQCMEVLYSFYSVVLFLEKGTLVIAHVIANDLCTTCIQAELQQTEFLQDNRSAQLKLYQGNHLITNIKQRMMTQIGDQETNDFFTTFKFGAAAKILIPFLDPFLSLNEIIIIDADTYFCKDVQILWHEFKQFQDNENVALVPEQQSHYTNGWYTKGCKGKPDGRSDCAPYHLPYGLNSGVVLIKAMNLRRDEFNATIARIISQYGPKLHLADQDIWNVYSSVSSAAGNPVVHELPCEWNIRTDSMCDRRKQAALIHGNRWSLHHRSRGFAKGWLRLGQMKSIQAGKTAEVQRKQILELQHEIQQFCKSDSEEAPWP